MPPRFREDFRAGYEAALDAAHDFDQFKCIREVLHLWRLRSVAYSRPHHEEAIRAAKEGRDEEFVGADLIPGWAEPSSSAGSTGAACWS
ncbi:hypothetical protein GCM10022214_61190 [Actinomadura miaoliensis]|uniref:Uncharacterized protein n=1 Tax=Actinomadura miaoliensis TaxID=430685 RepID=A0ABP7WLT3_9ACTN